MATDFDAARSALRREQVAPFHAWRLRRPTAATIREADNDLNNGWVREADRAVIDLAAPHPWDEVGVTAIAREETHAWSMVDALLVAYSATGSWPYLETAVELAEDWIDRGAGTEGSWHPRATVGRSHRLGYIVHAAAVVDALDMTRWRPLARLAERHAARLEKITDGLDGMLARVAGRSLTVRLGSAFDLIETLPDAVIAAVADACDRNGVPASPSTADHLAVVTALAAIDQDDAEIDLTELRRPAEDALAWLITTDGHPANFGATALEPVNGLWRGGDVAVQELLEPFVSQALCHALSAGSTGAAPTVDTKILEGPELLIIKPTWPVRPEETGPYVAADRATGDFVWHDAGRPLLVAPGTTAAALSGGSAVRVMSAADWLATGAGSNALSIEPKFDATGWTSRVGTLNEASFVDIAIEGSDVRIRRTVVVGPGRWLLVVDWLAGGSPRTATQQFLLGPDLAAIEEADRYLVVGGDEPVMWAAPLHGAPERTGVHTGGRESNRGPWWAPRPGRVAPANQIGWSATGSHALLASLFSLNGPPQVEAAGEWSFAFSVDGFTTRIALGEGGLTDLQEVPK